VDGKTIPEKFIMTKLLAGTIIRLKCTGKDKKGEAGLWPSPHQFDYPFCSPEPVIYELPLPVIS